MRRGEKGWGGKWGESAGVEIVVRVCFIRRKREKGIGLRWGGRGVGKEKGQKKRNWS